MFATQPDFNDLRFYNDLLPLRTEEALQFIDLTTWVGETVRRSGVGHGYVQIQVLHTTAAIVANENEPLLLEDFKKLPVQDIRVVADRMASLQKKTIKAAGKKPTKAEQRRLADVLTSLAMIQATSPIAKFRNGEKAVSHAKRACKLSGYKVLAHVSMLAAAYAESGDFEQAISDYDQAISLDA